jgi:hypothetical protein
MRTILDGDLQLWEVYATTGDFGSAKPAKVGFRCTTDASERPRVLVYGGDKSEAERCIAESSDAELLGMLGSAERLS